MARPKNLMQRVSEIINRDHHPMQVPSVNMADWVYRLEPYKSVPPGPACVGAVEARRLTSMGSAVMLRDWQGELPLIAEAIRDNRQVVVEFLTTDFKEQPVSVRYYASQIAKKQGVVKIGQRVKISLKWGLALHYCSFAKIVDIAALPQDYKATKKEKVNE